MSAWINDYLQIPYVDGGRDCRGFDCWGMVRHVLHHHFGVPWLTSFGHVSPDDKVGMTDGYWQEQGAFVLGPCATGSVACGFRGDCLVHVGVVVSNGQQQVLHTGRSHGPALNTPRAFRRLFERVEFYEYQDAKRLD